jgi:hypothetical protein
VRRVRRLIMHLTLLLTVATAFVACGMLTAVASTATPQLAHERAMDRWQQRGFTSYRVALRIEALGRVCYQLLEVRGEWVRESITNTCDTMWLEALTVDRLFDLGAQIEELPISRCGPSSQPCPCHRIFTERNVYYDERLGFPSMILARSEMQWNWTSADFWQALAESRELPSCTRSQRRLTVQVLALTPVQ